MEFKGTKGKWDYTTTSWNGDETEIWGIERNHAIARMVECDNTIANALLISKAPEMLEMIIEFINEFDLHGDENEVIINKAKKIVKEATDL